MPHPKNPAIMFLSQFFNCEFVNRFRYVIRMATAIQCIAMVVAILYLFLQYRKAKNAVWRRRRAIRHHQVLKDIGCFKWVPLRFYSKVPSGEYLCGRNGQQMAFKKIVAVRRDPPLNRIMEQMKPVKISRENRIVPPKDVILLTIYL
ncbi:hypothetical protein T12_298 [Trichinella patagoniensis]|uniref:Uncharacterized protein n=1 Tax=Trichinella patagoniensis TaxID=990121 RepID=A0A0V0ZM39_9BILA|nr:hypothetical protein T12_298 [Trichinella patagoniensis]